MMTESAAEDGTGALAVPFISRVRLKNYKSIASCDVRLGSLTILVGPNGSGKSNFLDALGSLGRAVATTPAEAIESRGGMTEILQRVPQQTESFGIDIEAMISWGLLPHQQVQTTYGFEIGLPSRRGLRPFEVIYEECTLHWDNQVWRFRAERGRVDIQSPDQAGVAVFEADRLYLLVADMSQPWEQATLA